MHIGSNKSISDSKSYNNSVIKRLGEIEVSVSHNNINFENFKFLVVEGGEISLLGKDLIKLLNMGIEIFLKDYKDIFSK